MTRFAAEFVSAVDAFPGGAAFIAALIAVFVGGLVQGALGFGLGLVSIPVLGLLIPEHLPQAVVLAGLPLTVLMFLRERGAVRLRVVGWLLLGRALGVVPAILVLTVVPVRALQMLFAVSTITAVVLMVADRVALKVDRTSQFVVGSIAGFVGTAAGFGGPPVALLYSRESGPALRATLSLMMLVGTAASIVGYGLGGRLTHVDIALGAILLIPTVLGLGASLTLRRHLNGPRLRSAVLLLVTTSALVLFRLFPVEGVAGCRAGAGSVGASVPG